MEDAVAATVEEEEKREKGVLAYGYGQSRGSSSGEVANVAGGVPEEDEDACRICRGPGDAGNPLRYPCACRGTIKYVHQDCLLQWLNRRKISHCEVCRHEFSYTPIYAMNAPARLSPLEFVLGLAAKFFRLLGKLQHLAYLFFVWLLIIPFITHWVWEFSFFKGFSEAQSLFTSRLTLTAIFADCLHGFLLSLGMAYIFLGITFIRVSFMREPRGAPGLANRIFAANENGENAGGRQGTTHIRQIIKRNVAFLADWWKVSVAHIMVYLGIVEFAPINELANVEAPIFPLDENAFAVVASNLVFTIVVVLLPFCLGRIATLLQSWLFSHTTADICSSVVPMIEAALSSVNTTAKDAPKAIAYFVSYCQGISVPEKFFGESTILNTEIMKMDKASNSVNGIASAGIYNNQPNGTPSLSDDTTLFIGYMVILSFFFCYLGTVSMKRFVRGEPLNLQMLSGLAFMIDAILSLVRRFFALFRHLMTMLSRNFLAISKVSLILGLKVGIFPLMCGWWLDVCTLRIFGQTIAERIELSVKNPILMSLAYWIVGIFYLVYFLLHMNVIQEVLRDGVFCFLPDVADPENFFSRIIECPMFKHARGFLLLVGLHASVIVMLVFLPIKLAILYAPSTFPINLFNSEVKTFSAILLRRCLFHFGIPCTIQFYYPSANFKVFLHKWLIVICSLLGLSDFLLPRDEGNDGNVELVRRQRVRNISMVAIIEGSIIGSHTPRNSDATEDDRGDKGQEADPQFVLRILILLVFAWMTALVFNSLMMAVPILLGRKLFQAASHLIAHGFQYDDFCSFITGSCIVRAVLICSKYAMEHVQTRGVRAFLIELKHYILTAFKICAVVSFSMFVIPIVIGLLLDLVVVPIRLPLDERLIIGLFQYWVLGWLFLITLFGLVQVDNMHSVDERWRVKLQRVLDDGFAHRPALWVLKEILAPTTMRLLIALATPYIFARLVSTILGYPLPVNSTVHRFVWPGCFALSIMWFCARILYKFVIHLHKKIRDDRYCVGRRLQDYGEEIPEKPTEENALKLQE